jgi:hypothetical protein
LRSLFRRPTRHTNVPADSSATPRLHRRAGCDHPARRPRGESLRFHEQDHRKRRKQRGCRCLHSRDRRHRRGDHRRPYRGDVRLASRRSKAPLRGSQPSSTRSRALVRNASISSGSWWRPDRPRSARAPRGTVPRACGGHRGSAHVAAPRGRYDRRRRVAALARRPVLLARGMQRPGHHAAAGSYSWMRPPSRSRRFT